jgi:uncharacterized protein YecE (DUF72 family)
MAKKGKVHVGTSGWLYKHWRGTFYPKAIKQKDEFAYYSLFFNTVELNNPFYRLPSRETFENWRKNSKPGFLYIVKASRFITHIKKLKDTAEALAVFLNNCDGLEEKLGPILFQLPPGWQLNIERFETFLKSLPKGYRFAFEFRNATWYDERVYQLMKRYNCAFCIYQLAGHMSPIEITGDFVYLRLHGPTNNKYQGSYDFYTLRAWAEKSREWQNAGKDVYIYFDNDDSGYAAFNAQVIEMMLNKAEPITKQEVDILALVISAIKQQKVVEFYYESNSGKGRRKVEPYLIAINKKGRGDIYFTGYVHSQESKRSGDRDGPGQYLLNKIDINRFKILDEGFEEIKVADELIFGELATERVVYRTSVRNKKPMTASLKKLPAKAAKKATAKRKRSASNSKKKR